MCLALPGEILSVEDERSTSRTGRVRFGGIVKVVNLALLPEAEVSDWVLVHAGVGISRLDEAEARRVFDYLEQIGEVDEVSEA